MSNMPMPGWYPDPSGAPRQRYWDGQKWDGQRWADAPVPQTRPDKTKWIAGGIVALVALVLLIAIASTSGNNKKTVTETNTAASAPSTGSVTTAKPAKPAGPVVASAGSSVRDGKFEFQVLGVDRSATKEGVFTAQQAKGEFFIVKVRVTNIGDDARSFSASSQHLIVNGNKYDATSSLSDNTWMDNINPGLEIEGTVSFDIPQGSVPEAVEFHDSMFSGGARVAL